jgi:hypothetical protein
MLCVSCLPYIIVLISNRFILNSSIPSESRLLLLLPFFPPERMSAQFSEIQNVVSKKASTGVNFHRPECSVTKLLRTGFSQSLHLTTPMSELSGWEPKSFMSRADSHDVGGDGRDEGSDGDSGEAGRASQEKGVVGGLVGLSFSAMKEERKQKVNTCSPFGKIFPPLHVICSCPVVICVFGEGVL